MFEFPGGSQFVMLPWVSNGQYAYDIDSIMHYPSEAYMNPIQPGLGPDDIRRLPLTKLAGNKLKRIPDKAKYSYL